jgi:hypothetical protein
VLSWTVLVSQAEYQQLCCEANLQHTAVFATCDNSNLLLPVCICKWNMGCSMLSRG